MDQRIIEVVDYDASWAINFGSERRLLHSVIGFNAVNIDHVGSTAVIGLAAKPVIDILVEVSSLELLDEQSTAIESLGYIAKCENGIAARRYFQKGGNQHSHHLHAFKTGDKNLIRYWAFKEYMTVHSDIAAKYGQIKKQAVFSCNNNMNLYMALKNDFVQHHEKLALEWYHHRSAQLLAG